MITKIKNIIRNPWFYIVDRGFRLIYPIYQNFIVPRLVSKIRKKEVISVLFVVYELDSWKTENLYLHMKKHPRFLPQLLLVPYTSSTYAFETFKAYLNQKNYDFVTLKDGETIQKKISPDIIFYQKPYSGSISRTLSFPYNLSSLLCNVSYSFRNRCLPKFALNSYQYYLWQNYAENGKVVEELRDIFYNEAKNMVVTGLPMMDVLLQDKSQFENPWKDKSGKSRIIYAPHHTIQTESFTSDSPIDYSTFLLYFDYILELAEKYQNKVQWAFKPHPLLKQKLYRVWGKEKTDAYYLAWQNKSYTQLSEGEYLGLFKHSDAMIHDSGSFKIEYLYTGNPVLYLINENQKFDYPNWQTREALSLHYHAITKKEIEDFVINVINKKDEMAAKRDSFVKNYLMPPKNKTACENIEEFILGVVPNV